MTIVTDTILFAMFAVIQILILVSQDGQGSIHSVDFLIEFTASQGWHGSSLRILVR